MEHLDYEKILHYKKIFEFFDKDKDGVVSKSEFNQIIKHLLISYNPSIINNKESIDNSINILHDLSNLTDHSHLSGSLVNYLLSEFDIESSDFIELEDFIIIMIKKYNDITKVKQDIITAFQAFDKNNTNVITRDDLIHVLTYFEYKLPIEDINEILQDFNPANPDTIDYLKFIDFLIKM